MSALFRGLAFLVLTGSIALPLALLAGVDGNSGGSAGMTGRDVERVRNALVARPELVLEAIQTLQQREAQSSAPSQAAQSRRLVQTHAAALFGDPLAPVIGNPNGDVTLVEFFDYRCPYCKQAHAVVSALIAEDSGIRVVHKHLPVLGPDSVLAARAALAAQRQNNYGRFHDALMQSRGTLSEEWILTTATAIGLDRGRLKSDMADEGLLAALRQNVALAEALNIRGTPSYVVGDSVHFGAPGASTLRGLVAKARKKG